LLCLSDHLVHVIIVMRMIEILRLPLGKVLQSRIVIRAASSAAGNPQSDADFNPYEVIDR